MTETAAGFVALDDAALEVLFEERPDLLDPVPADLADLAVRASRPSSLRAALANLDSLAGVVAEALALVDGPVTPGPLAAMLGVAQTDIEDACARLVRIGLAVRHPDARTSPVANLRAAISGPPLGLGPPMRAGLGRHGIETLRAIAARRGLPTKGGKAHVVEAIAAASAPAELIGVLADLSPEAALLLDRLDGQGGFHAMLPWGWVAGTFRTPVEQLAAQALVVPLEWDVWGVPLEVSMAMRGGHLVRAIPAREPAIERAPGTPEQVVGAAAEASVTVLRGLSGLLDELEAKPTPLLKQGGVGVAQVRRLAKKLGTDEKAVALLLELALPAGLIGVQGEILRPTERSDAWRARSSAERWLAVVEAWLATPRFPSVAGERRVSDDKPVPALVPHPAGGEGVRRAVLRLVGARGALGVASAARALAWRYPRRFDDAPARVEILTEWVVREALVLGVLCDLPGHPGFVVAAPTTEALLGGAHDVALALARLSFPAVVDRFTVQADSTVIVAGELEGAAAAVLADLADRESAGAASVWRLSDASVARALDRGHSATELVAYLQRHASHGVPQAVSYLVTDVGRRHGRVRVAPALTVVHGKEPSLIAEVQASRRCARLGLRAVAPTVLVSSHPPAEVAGALREAGFLPGVEHADGTVAIERAIGPRAQASRLGDPSPVMRHQAVDVGDVIARLRAASRPPTAADRAARGMAPARPPLALVREPPPCDPVREPPARGAPVAPPAPAHRLPSPAVAPRGSPGSAAGGLASLVARRIEVVSEIRPVLAEAIRLGAMVELGYVSGKGDFTAVEALPLSLGEHDLLAVGDHGQQTYLLERLRHVMPLDDGSDLVFSDGEVP